jgi:V/A-type H+-transporting ATPase subunit D
MAEPRVPPGRAGRLWLQHRLGTAERAVTLLDRKLRILRIEQERFRMLAERTGAQWTAASRTAESWLARAAALGGQREIRLAMPAGPALATVRYSAVMGVRYPVEATCQPPDAVAGGRPAGTAALIEADRAYRDALRAAVAHAAADAARRTVEAELAETRRQLHAISDRWVPSLHRALHELSERLEEAERAETVRLRWARRETDHSGAST